MFERVAKATGVLLAAVIGATGLAGPAQATVSDPIPIDYGTKHVTVKVYSRDIGSTKDSPTFKYADLLNRAARYKDAHPGTDVSVKFAMYTMAYDVYVGVNPDDPATYGYVEDNDFGGDNSEKLVWSILKAAEHQVNVEFAYQHDKGVAEGTVLQYLTDHMGSATTDPTRTVADFLKARKVDWGTNDHGEQMHAKYMTVNHYLGDTGDDITDTTYVTTTNVDQHTDTGTPVSSHDWVQSGTLVNGHAELAQAYNRYFRMIYDNSTDQAAFHTAVRTAHAQGTLNYDDERFSAYFYPMPSSPADGWDTSFNPIAKYVDEMGKVDGDRYMKMNMFFMTTGAYGDRLYNELAAMYNSPEPGVKHFRLAFQDSQDIAAVDAAWDAIGRATVGETHTKNTQFAFSQSKRYYSMTGSANLAANEITSKANSTLVIKEFTAEHPVYNEFKKVYEYVTLD